MGFSIRGLHAVLSATIVLRAGMRRKDIRPSDENPTRLVESEEPAVRLSVPQKRKFHGEFVPKGKGAAVTSAEVPESAEGMMELDPEERWKESAPPFRIPIGYSVLGLVFSAGALIWTFVLMLSVEEPMVAEFSEVSLRIAEGRAADRYAAEFLDQLKEATSSYLAATTVEEKVRYVRHPDRVRPLMEDYYASHEMVPVDMELIASASPVGLELASFLVLTVSIGPEESSSLKTLILEETADGDFLFDWETEVAYQPIPLEEFISRQPEDSVALRLFAARDSFYCFEFSDDSRFASYKLTERDSPAFLFGYAEKGGEVEEELEGLLRKGSSGREPALLRVRFLPETNSIRSVLIEEVIEPRWLYLESPASP